MKSVAFRCMQFAGTFVITITIFCICMYLTCLISLDSIKTKAIESYYILDAQGVPYHFIECLSIDIDNATDLIIINEQLSIDPSQPFISFMKARRNYHPNITEIEMPDLVGEGACVIYSKEHMHEHFGYNEYSPNIELGDFLRGRLHVSLNYARYWHGYFILYRPLLIFFNVAQIRWLFFCIFISLFIYFLYLLYKRFSLIIAIIYGSSLTFTGYFTAAFSLESNLVFLVSMVSAIILLKRIDKIKNFSLFLFVVACTTNFMDYLTVPLVSLGMLCSLYLLKLLEDGKDWIYCLRFVVLNSLIWLLGYACTWSCKWVLYDLTIHDGHSMIQIGVKQFLYRTSRINRRFLYLPVQIMTITLEMIGKASLFALITAGVVMYVQKFRITIQGFNKKALPFLFLALLPIVWFLALTNHTLLHYFFTYRQTFVYMLGVLLAIHEMLWPHSDLNTPSP